MRGWAGGVHRGCPEVVETIKWGAPASEHHGYLGSMAAFKAHAAFGFRNEALLAPDPKARQGRGQFGRMAPLADLPPERAFLSLVRKAAALNQQGIKRPRPKRPKAAIPMPRDLAPPA